MTTPSPNAQLLVEKSDGILTLTLSNPARRNALHPDIYTTGITALSAAATDPTLGAVILTGEGKDFCAGGNLNRLAASRKQPPAVQRASLAGFHRWIQALRQCPKPVIAAIEGNAAGAGFSLALACDLIVAAENARFTMAYVKVGLSPDGGASAHLAECLPRQLAHELLLLGNTIESQRLYTLGLICQITPPGKALAGAHTLAARLANGPRQAQQRIKRLLTNAATQNLEAQLETEADAFIDSLFGQEAEEGINAFLTKRPPDFRLKNR